MFSTRPKPTLSKAPTGLVAFLQCFTKDSMLVIFAVLVLTS
ncbi:hypothetical protein [Clostridium saccharobutylicum]|nr:hypothetical protein [Clostridium saccharobutylicum]MBA2907596.1 hypothetical protein [Clostridium saccharobutylicum]MBA8898873.1 hypothetical protein [Clostridium saccharobutylicum]MBA8980735.1 hypothetical protein [Clostridium saccharobutylicum]MBA8999019.1 hypothetical protein [Clostridium saccharobutylicum]MBA9010484.1 hypothetical protein [Clostridium saccharobutylicum]